MADIEIRVTSKTSGDAFGDLQKQAAKAQADLKAVASAATIEGKVSMDLGETEAATRILKEIDSFDPHVDIEVDTSDIGRAQEEFRQLQDEARRTLAQATYEVMVKGHVEMDLNEVELAKARIRDLGSIPPPDIKVNVDDSSVRAAGNTIERELGEGGERGADKIASAMGDIDFGNIGESAADNMANALASAGPWAAAAGSIAAVFGDEFMAGFNDALPAARTDLVRSLRYNLSGPEMAEVGTVAGEIYSSGLAGALTKGELREAVAMVKSELGSVGDDFDLTSVTKQALLLSEVLGIDLVEAISTAESLVARELVPSVEDGMQLMLELAQKTGVEWEEMQELINEFGPAISALGIDAEHGFGMMADIFEKRLTPQLDQAGEIFEELNEEITNGGAADAIERIGLNSEDMIRRVLNGGPDAAAAIAEIARAVLDVPDPAARAAAAIEIFGGNVNLMGDQARDAILEIFATADATDELGSSLRDSVDDMEDTSTGLDRLKRMAESVGTELGNTAAQFSEAFDALMEMEWGRLEEPIAQLADTLSNRLIGPLSILFEMAGEDPFEPLKTGARELKDVFQETGDTGASAGRQFLEAGEQGGSAGRKFDEAAGGIDNARDSLEEATSAVDLLAEAFDSFGGRFDEAQLMRKIVEETEAATAAVKGLEDGTYTLGEGFDISTEKGRNAQAAFEDLSGVLDDAIRSYENGAISGQQLADKHAQIEAAVREVASEMNATEAETEELIGTYARVPPSVETMFNAYTQAAQGAVAAYAGAIAAIPRTVNTYATTYQQTIVRPTASTDRFGQATGGVTGAAAAGGVHQNLTLVGEYGPELVDLAPGSYVHTASDTQRMLGEASSTGDGMTMIVHVHGSVLSDRDLAEKIRDMFYAGDWGSFNN